MAREDAGPVHGSRSQKHRGTGTPHDFHFPVIAPDGSTIFIVRKIAAANTASGIEILVSEDGTEWIKGTRAGHVVPAW
jgi:hypothetical protein